MKKLLALTLSLLLMLSVMPVALVSAEGAVAKIGDVEYASLFGADGALLNAVDGDTIVVLQDETVTCDVSSRGSSFVIVNSAITLDLAGHTITGSRSNSTNGIFIKFAKTGTIVRSTVDGLGVTDTETRGVITAKATVVAATKGITFSNVNLTSTLSDDTFGNGLSIETTELLTAKNCYFKAPKMCVRATSKANVDFDDSIFAGDYYSLRSTSTGGAISGTFDNCSFEPQKSGAEIYAGDVTFTNCTFTVMNGSTYDWTALKINSGTVKLVDSTVNCKGRAKYGINVASTSKLIVDNVTINSTKNAASYYPLLIGTTASAELGNAFLTGNSSANAASNVNLYPYLAEGKAIYTSDIPSEETLVAKDYDPASYKVLYIRDSLQAATTYDITIDGEVVETVVEGKTYVVPAAAEGYHYTDGTTDYYEGDEIVVNANVNLTSEINTYSVTVDGVLDATVDHGNTYTVPVAGTGYQYTDGAVRYDGGEVITVTADIELTKVVKVETYTYTMDEGSRIAGGSTNTISESGKFIEVDGDWVLALPSKGDQVATFILPEDWYVKPNYKAVNIKFSVSRSANAADYNEYVNFTDDVVAITISEGYKGLQSTYSVDVDSSNYGFRYFKTKLKGGSNFTEAKDYIYIDDVTVTFEYDPNYVAPEVEGETTTVITTQDSAAIRLGEVNGMRFYTSIDETAFAEFVGDKNYEIGTLIAPKDLAGEYLTVDDDHVKVVFDMSKGLYDGKYVVGSIVNLKSSNSYNVETGNIAREFVARAYVLVDGVYYYSDVQSVRSLAYVANAYVNDPTSNYETLDVDTKALVDAWASKFNG